MLWATHSNLISQILHWIGLRVSVCSTGGSADYLKADASCRRTPKYERCKRNKHIKFERMGNGHIRTYAVLEGFNQNGYLHHNQCIAACEAQVPGIVFGCFAESVSKAEKTN